MAEFGQPVFYRYFEHQVLKADTFGFRDTINQDVYLVVFGPDLDNIANPNVEPIGVYHYAGIRRYLWRDTFWTELDWDRRAISERVSELLCSRCSKEDGLAYRRILDLIHLASRCGAPSPTDTHPPLNDAFSQAVQAAFKFNICDFVVEAKKRKKYCRAMHKINA